MPHLACVLRGNGSRDRVTGGSQPALSRAGDEGVSGSGCGPFHNTSTVFACRLKVERGLQDCTTVGA